MKHFFLSLFILNSIFSFSQDKYISRNGKVQFNASTPLETIRPVNNHVSCILDTENGNIAFQLKMISFKFEKSLMEEHFNEKYVESEKFPKSTFIGKILDWDKIDWDKEDQNVQATGTLTIHGVDKEIQVPGIIRILQNDIELVSEFNVNISDFDIKIPKLVRNKISEQVEIYVDINLQPK